MGGEKNKTVHIASFMRKLCKSIRQGYFGMMYEVEANQVRELAMLSIGRRFTRTTPQHLTLKRYHSIRPSGEDLMNDLMKLRNSPSHSLRGSPGTDIVAIFIFIIRFAGDKKFLISKLFPKFPVKLFIGMADGNDTTFFTSVIIIIYFIIAFP